MYEYDKNGDHPTFIAGESKIELKLSDIHMEIVNTDDGKGFNVRFICNDKDNQCITSGSEKLSSTLMTVTNRFVAGIIVSELEKLKSN